MALSSQERDRSVEPTEERARIRRNLAVLQWAALSGGALGTASSLAAGNTPSALILLVGITLLMATVWLRRRGAVRVAAAVFLMLLIAVIHVLCTIGGGVHDTATILYPVAILSAALMLDRGLLVTVTLACIASVAILVGGNPNGPPDWLAILDVSVILTVTATAVFLLVRDVVGSAAEARRSERRLAQAYEDLARRTGELERFTYVVSHDLKSPLVTIRGFLEYVAEAGRSGDVAALERDLLRIRKASDRMGRLLDDLLELSRTGRLERPREEMRFGEVVQEASSLVEGQLVARDVRVRVDPAAAALEIRGDRAALVQLMQNLLDNGAKLAGEGGPPTIVVGARDGRTDGEGPVFTVADNGPGIAPEDQEGIFELFRQLDPGGQGTGLGLALGRRIVEAHGGRLWAESEGPGRGATFCFTLPRAGSGS